VFVSHRQIGRASRSSIQGNEKPRLCSRGPRLLNVLPAAAAMAAVKPDSLNKR
jgi:hypothetical protein